MGKESDSVTDARSASLGEVTFQTSVMFHCWPDVPTLFPIQLPSETCLRINMSDHFGAWGCKRSRGEVEGSVEVRVRRQLRIAVGIPEEIEGDVGLRDESVPF